MLEKQLAMVERFHREVTGIPIPDQPTMLTGERLQKGTEHLSEELLEFEDADTVGDQADALIDLIYVAYGRLLEMGIRPGPAFDLVHEANMRKVSGPNKRGTTYEAAKPPGWHPPNWGWFFAKEAEDRGRYIRGRYIGLKDNDDLHAERVHNSTTHMDRGILELRDSVAPVPRKPKVLLLGHGRHGKDTVAEMLHDGYELSFTSSSMVCAKEVMMPYFERVGRPYLTVEACFADRHNHRGEWFGAIEAFNSPDKSSLGKIIFEGYDIYCGLRSAREFAAVKNSGLYDVCIWVDASQRQPPEGRDSCTVEPWMADYVLDNNGTVEDLKFNLDQLMETVTRRFNAQH